MTKKTLIHVIRSAAEYGRIAEKTKTNSDDDEERRFSDETDMNIKEAW